MRGAIRTALRLIGVLVVLALVGLGVGVARAWPHARAAYAAAQDLRALRHEVEGWPTPEQVNRLRENVAVLDAEMGYAYRLLSPTFSLLRHLGPTPWVGPAVAGIPDVLTGARHALHAGRLALDALAPALPPHRPDRLTDLVGPLLDRVAAEERDLAAVQEEMALAARAFARVPADAYPGRAARVLHLAQEGTRLGEKGVALLRLSPALLGQDRERVWLVIAQNNEELRPTGGFISAVGTVRVRRGQPGEITFVDSYRLYSPRHAYPPAPPAMREWLYAPILLFRDANWWPDVPTSARVLARFYEMETGDRVDGVIFIDLDALRLLVDGVGGLNLPDGIRVDADNVFALLYQAWNNPPCEEGASCNWWSQRKAFLNVLAAAMLKKVQTAPRAVPPLRFARRLVQALDEHHLVIVPLAEGDARAVVARYGWDAAMRPGDGDYLRITETNVGFNKANAKVERRITYRVDLRDPTTAVATLEIEYTHTSRAHLARCYHIAHYGLRYEDMQDRCYWNYLRVNVPQGARLLERHGFRAGNATVAAGDAGTTEFAGVVVVPPGETRTVTLRYTLPPAVVRGRTYRLRVEKQPGARATPFTLVMETASPPHTVHFTLDMDREFQWPVVSGAADSGWRLAVSG